jgi:hypothetical protein
MHSKRILKIGIVLQLLFSFACSRNPSPEPSKTPKIPPLAVCGDNLISKEAEEGFMEKYFEYIFLYETDAGKHLEMDQEGTFLLVSGHNLAVAYKTAFPNHLRLCIQEFNEYGNVVSDSFTNTDGIGMRSIRKLEPGQYVLRAIVKNYVIKSFTLKVFE